MQYTLMEVNDKKTVREFLHLPISLYKNNPLWIRPLDNDVESVFDPARNKHFRHGEAIRWVLRDKKGICVGRVAAFVDRKVSKSSEQPTGGMGFFECINDAKAAYTLFDACKKWLEQKGMEALDGPVNFGERDRWWGLHVDGEFEPNYCMNYHHGYYKEFFESYGFKTYFNQFTYHLPVSTEQIDPIMWEKAQRIISNPKYSVKKISKKELDKFADDFVEIYNKAWGRFTGVGKMTKAQAMIMLNQMKLILDERLIQFAYYEEMPIGFLVMVPELNQAVKYLNGNFNILGQLKMMYLIKVRKVCTKALGIVFGIIPQYQGKGVDGALIEAFARWAVKDKYPFTDIEMNWIGDFNPGMLKLMDRLGATVRKTHITYRLMFDPSKEVTPPRRVS